MCCGSRCRKRINLLIHQATSRHLMNFQLKIPMLIRTELQNLKIKTDPRIASVFEKYPDEVRPKMMKLRRLILETASEIEDLTEIEETLKWGEPSYLTKYGSTIRFDWKAKNPNQYAMYFKCTSKLVPTFKALFNEVFTFEKNRAIIFQLEDEIPEAELKKCILAGLTYHRVKHLPLLGL